MSPSDDRAEQNGPARGAGDENEVPDTTRPRTTPDGEQHYHPAEAEMFGEEPGEVRQPDDEHEN